MTQTPESFEKETISFLKHYTRFKSIIYKRSNYRDSEEITNLFRIFIKQQEYKEVK